jgi:hypothetical protein
MNGPGAPVKKEVGRKPAALPDPFHWGSLIPGLVKSPDGGPVYGKLRMFIPLKLFVTLLPLTTGWDKSEPYTPGGRPPIGPWLVGVICVPKGVVERALSREPVGFKPGVNGAFRPEIPTGPRANSLAGAKVTSAKVANPADAVQTRRLKDFMLSPVYFDAVYFNAANFNTVNFNTVRPWSILSSSLALQVPRMQVLFRGEEERGKAR